MQVKLDAFRALVLQKAGPVRVDGTPAGFELTVGTAKLATEAGNLRIFKNLTTLARFARGEDVIALTVDISQMPKKIKKRAAQPVAAPPAKAAAKKQPARKAAAKKQPARKVAAA